MKTRRSLVSLLLLPALSVSGFQQQSTTPAIQSRTVHQRLDGAVFAAPPVMEDAPPTTTGEDNTEEHANRELPLVIQHIVDERREFQMNLGKAMDTLRKDYPDILHKSPDFSIYHDDIRVLDPSGVQLSGLTKYKHSFTFFQTLIRFVYSPTRSGLQYRMMYDFARSEIRISWNAILSPKVELMMSRPMHVDGISIYKLDASGKIVQHRVEKLVINNTPVAPPYGILTRVLQEEFRLGDGATGGVPVGVGA